MQNRSFIDPELFEAHKNAQKASEVPSGAQAAKADARMKGLEVNVDDEFSVKKKRETEHTGTLALDRIHSSLYRPINAKAWSKSRWISCLKCKTWRRISLALPFESLLNWDCSQHSDEKFNDCSKPLEELHGGEIKLKGEEHNKSYTEEKDAFIDHLKDFLKKFKFPALRTPLLGGKELDLYRLYREVIYEGGYDAVVAKPGTWSRIFRSLENSHIRKKITDASYRLKWYYVECLYAYEQFHFHGKDMKTIQVPSRPKRSSRSATKRAKMKLDKFTSTFWHQAKFMSSQKQWGSIVYQSGSSHAAPPSKIQCVKRHVSSIHKRVPAAS